MKYLNTLLFFIPVMLIASLLEINESLIFFSACLSIIPLAAIIGIATEQISFYTSPKVSGLLNATMSNVPELFIGLFAVKAGLYKLVLASMAGSIIGNILLVLGVSIFTGGLRYKYQTFSKSNARSNFVLLCFAAISIIIPITLKYALSGHKDSNAALVSISFGLAILMVSIYVLGLVFSLITHKNLFTRNDIAEDTEETTDTPPKWSFRRSLLILFASAIFVALSSEILIGTVEHVVKDIGIPEMFIGIILIPILGNVAEHASAVIMALKNKVDISVEIAIGSSMQISLFVAPVLVLASFLIGNPMQYLYDSFEVVAIIISIVMSLYIFQDGKTSWLEGIILISTYIAFALAFFFI